MTARVYLPSVICAECYQPLQLTTTEKDYGKVWFYVHDSRWAPSCSLANKRIVAEAAEMDVAE